MKHSFYLYTTFSLLIILSLVISGYIFGWTVPSANPPSSNLSPPLNTSSQNQAKVGYLSIGTSTTPTYPLEVGNQLRVWGQLISKVASGTAPFVVDSPTKITNLNSDLLDGYDSADLLGGGTLWGYAAPPGNCAPYNDCDGDGKTALTGDCDESCPTCYVASSYFTTSPDGKDQDCDGQVDESANLLYVYMSPTSYTGNLGGRSGADSKCDLGTTLNCVTGRNRAFLSVNAEDEIRDMPTNYGYPTSGQIYWYNRTHGTTVRIAANWADMLDGTIEFPQNSGTGNGGGVWTGSTASGTLSPLGNCKEWTDESSKTWSTTGSSMATDYQWQTYGSPACSSLNYIRCICMPSGYQ